MKPLNQSLHRMIMSLSEIRRLESLVDYAVVSVLIQWNLGYEVHEYKLQKNGYVKTIQVQVFDDDTIGIVTEKAASDKPWPPTQLRKVLENAFGPYR